MHITCNYKMMEGTLLNFEFKRDNVQNWGGQVVDPLKRAKTISLFLRDFLWHGKDNISPPGGAGDT